MTYPPEASALPPVSYKLYNIYKLIYLCNEYQCFALIKMNLKLLAKARRAEVNIVEFGKNTTMPTYKKNSSEIN